MIKPLASTLALSLALVAGAAQAQAAAPAAASAPAPKVSAAKKALVAKVLQLLQPGLEGLSNQLAESPLLQMQPQVNSALQQLAPDKREAVAKQIEADARSYMQKTAPVIRDHAVKLAPTTVGPVLEANLTEDELKQIVTILESPANRKFQSLQGDIQRALGQKLVAESRPTLDANVQEFRQSVVKQLQAAQPAASAASGAKP